MIARMGAAVGVLVLAPLMVMQGIDINPDAGEFFRYVIDSLTIMFLLTVTFAGGKLYQRVIELECSLKSVKDQIEMLREFKK